MVKCAYLYAFRALEWLGDEPTKDASLIPAANRYLAPLGLTFDSPITSLDLLKKFDPERKNPETGADHAERYEGVALANARNGLSGRTFQRKARTHRHHSAVHRPPADEGGMESRVNMGWSINYGTIAALWSLSNQVESLPVGK